MSNSVKGKNIHRNYNIKSCVHSVCDFIRLTEKENSLDNIGLYFDDFICKHGFTEFNALNLELDILNPPHHAVSVLKYNPAWTNNYVEKQYSQIDPLFIHAITNANPVIWHDVFATTPLTRKLRQMLGEASEFAHLDGVTVPIRAFGSLPGVVSITSDRPVEPNAAMTVHLLSLYFFEACRNFAARKAGFSINPHMRPLSPRESECLRWVAAGKSAWDIGLILSLSEATVRDYIASAKRKLGVHTIAQAVAHAILSAQIKI